MWGCPILDWVIFIVIFSGFSCFEADWFITVDTFSISLLYFLIVQWRTAISTNREISAFNGFFFQKDKAQGLASKFSPNHDNL